MVKVISLSDEAYNRLSQIKNQASFSQVIINLIVKKEKKDLSLFCGIWDKDKSQKIKKNIEKERAKNKLRGVKF